MSALRNVTSTLTLSLSLALAAAGCAAQPADEEPAEDKGTAASEEVAVAAPIETKCGGWGGGFGWGRGWGWGFGIGWPYWGFAWNPFWYGPYWYGYGPYGYGYGPYGYGAGAYGYDYPDYGSDWSNNPPPYRQDSAPDNDSQGNYQSTPGPAPDNQNVGADTGASLSEGPVRNPPAPQSESQPSSPVLEGTTSVGPTSN